MMGLTQGNDTANNIGSEETGSLGSNVRFLALGPRLAAWREAPVMTGAWLWSGRCVTGW